MSRQDEIAAKAVRKSTLTSIKLKRRYRLATAKRVYEEQVRQINIQYSNDPERLKAKYAAEEFARSEKRKARAEKRIAAYKKQMELSKSKRIFSQSEEIASSIIQGIGTCFAIAALAIYLAFASAKAQSHVTLTITMYALFGSFIILMYLFSIFRHALTNGVAKEVFQRLSHVCSFLAIGFAYTAFTLTKIEGVVGWVLFGIVWALTITGSFIYAIGGSKYEKATIILFIISGWSGISVANILYKVLSMQCLRNMILACVIYIVGVIFYSLRKVKYMHFVGNCAMLCGNIFMFFSLLYLN